MGEGVFKRMSDPERRDQGQLFVSYARADSSPVRSMVERARAWGFSVWYDDSIRAGEYFNVSIQRAIEDCYLLIVCLSEASVQSDWVVKEVMFANQSKKDILPVKMGVLPPAHSLKLVLVNHQMLDSNDANFGDGLKTAVKRAHARVFNE
jgi:TIR domain